MIGDGTPRSLVDAYVGRRMCTQRMAKSMSREQLATRLNTKVPTIKRFENGVDRISASKLFEISRILDVPVYYFFDGYQPEG